MLGYLIDLLLTAFYNKVDKLKGRQTIRIYNDICIFVNFDETLTSYKEGKI